MRFLVRINAILATVFITLGAATEAPLPSSPTNGYQIVAFNWEHVRTPIIVALWLLLACLAKIAFRSYRPVRDAVPDSALMIGFGLVLGYAFTYLNIETALFSIGSSVFFLYVLPPIIFDAGYSMPTRSLYDNADSVLLFAFVGTVFNTMATGSTLMMMGKYNLFAVEYTTFEIYLFASLISCTDPVAVIAVFEELRINEFLYINVFGESLFNDGIAMASVIYQMLIQLPAIGDSATAVDYASCFVSFFYIAGGGVLVGVAYAIVASLITKQSQAEPLVGPIVAFTVPYIGWLTTELFGLASILGTTACGIVMKQYVKANLSEVAANSVKCLSKSLSVSIEALSFLFLGLTTTTSDHQWDTLFIVSTIACCTVYRIIAIVTMCSILNRRRLKKFSAADQIVLCYGGLRGVIVFAMVLALPTSISAKPMFFTATVALVCFTVFVQGTTIRPLLHLLRVERMPDVEPTLTDKFSGHTLEVAMSGVENIVGHRCERTLLLKFSHWNSKYVNPLLIRNSEPATAHLHSCSSNSFGNDNRTASV